MAGTTDSLVIRWGRAKACATIALILLLTVFAAYALGALADAVWGDGTLFDLDFENPCNEAETLAFFVPIAAMMLGLLLLPLVGSLLLLFFLLDLLRPWCRLRRGRRPSA